MPGVGVPNSTTADTCEAIDTGIGPVRPSGSTKPSGTASAVVYPATAAPCE
jgi:hypothetical protein